MKPDVLLALPDAVDPTPYVAVLAGCGEVENVKAVSGDSKVGQDMIINAARNGFEVTVIDVVYGRSETTFCGESYNGKVHFSAYHWLRQGWYRARALGKPVNYVVLSAWDHTNNVFEAYRCGARAFVSSAVTTTDTTPEPWSSNAFIEATLKAANGKTTYPGLELKNRNIAVALSNEVFGVLSVAEIQMVDMLINDYSTTQLQRAIDSKSRSSTNERIAKIIRKIGVSNREELVLHALDVGMEKPSSNTN